MDTSIPFGGNLDLENTKLLPKVFKIHPSQWLYQHIIYLFVCCNIMELRFSPLHHILDIVILDLDMLQLVMEQWVLQQLHAILVVAKDRSRIYLQIKQIS